MVNTTTKEENNTSSLGGAQSLKFLANDPKQRVVVPPATHPPRQQEEGPKTATTEAALTSVRSNDKRGSKENNEKDEQILGGGTTTEQAAASPPHDGAGAAYAAGDHNNNGSMEFIVAPVPLARGNGVVQVPVPGAHSVGGANNVGGGGGGVTGADELRALEEQAPQPPSVPDSGAGLAVANPVDENDTLPQAEDIDLEAANKRVERTKQIKTFVLVGVIVLVAVILVVIAFVIPTTKDDEAGRTTVQPTTSPTESPTLFVEDYVLSLLPEETANTVLGDPSSPQGQAYQWILDGDISKEEMTPERIRQRFALVTLFYASGGKHWSHNTNWLNHSVHECDWYHEPDFALKETISSLYPGYLTGFLDETPKICDNNGIYQHLWLDGNNLVMDSSSLPEELYLMTSLRTASVGYNHLTGGISSRIGQLTNLVGLAFNGIKNSGPIPSEVGLLTNLEILILATNDHTGQIPTEVWTQLTNLDTLSLAQNVALSDSIPTEIGNMSKMRFLTIGDSDLTGTIPTEFGQLEKLEFTVLVRNRLSGHLPSELGLLPSSWILNLSENKLEGTLPTELGQLSTTGSLKIWGNQLIGTLPSELGLLTGLTMSLDLTNNYLSGTIPTQLGLLSALQGLELRNNTLSGPIPSELGQLPVVGRLNFGNNSLSGTIPPELSALHQSLHKMTLDGNPLLSGIIPEAICNMNGACAPTPLDVCEMDQGLFMDCSTGSFLCGCDCPCDDGGNNNTSRV